MKIAHIVSAFPDRVTGPRNSVTLLSKYLNLLGGVESKVYSDVACEKFCFNDEVVYPLQEICLKNFDVVVFAGVYNRRNTILARECREKGVPYVISPRSSLVRASLYKSWLKKILFIYGYGRAYLAGCKAFHFLTEEERDFSVVGSEKSFILGNIVLPSPIGQQIKQKIIGFVGRYDIGHKGLDVLLKGIALAKKDLERSGWSVVLHGPDFKGGKSRLEEILRDYNLNEVVVLKDALHGTCKDDFLDKISIFIHTSRYEGQPQSVMEAMTRRNAIMVTPGTNMGSIVKAACCGEVVDLTPDSIASFFSSLPENISDLVPMQDSARKYAMERFGGEAIARDFFAQVTVLLGDKLSSGVS